MKKYTDLLSELTAIVEAKDAPTNEAPVSEDYELKSDILAPRMIEHLSKFFDQLSSAFQKNEAAVIGHIESELRKFGFSLGEVDMEDIGESEYDFFPIVFSTEEPVKNCYITVSFDRLSSGQQFALRPDGSALTVRAKVTLTEIDPEEFETLFAEADFGE